MPVAPTVASKTSRSREDNSSAVETEASASFTCKSFFRSSTNQLDSPKGQRRVTKNRRQQTFRERHGSKAENFIGQVSNIRAQLKAHQRYTKYVIHPGKTNSLLNVWDVITGIALIYTAIITPFEAAFMPASTGSDVWIDPWFMINRLLDIIFCGDMVLQFFLAYQSIDTFGGTVWVLDQRKIALHYVTTWFPLDFATVFVPGAFDFSLAFAVDGSSSQFAESAILLRVLRVIRLAKLVRLVRASRLYKRWQTRITMDSSAQTIVQCSLLLVVGAHWYACIIGMQTTLHPNPDTSWLGNDRYSYCDPMNYTALKIYKQGVEDGDIEAPALHLCPEMALFSWYVASFTWALMLITGTGGTDYYPSSASDGETIIVCILVVCGALLWTYVLALFCDMATNSNPGLTQFRQLLDGMNHFIRAHRLPKDMAHRLREYLHQQKPSQLGKFAERAIPVLSPTLQVEVLLYVHRMWLESTWFLRGLETSCLVRLAREMQMQTLAPGEVAPMHNLYVITRGLVLYGGRVLSRGMSWGDDVILSDTRYFLPFHARAMTYVDVLVLAADTLMQVMGIFPVSAARLRKKVIRLSLRRHLIASKKLEDRQKWREAHDNQEIHVSFLENLTHQGNQAGEDGASDEGSMRKRRLRKAATKSQIMEEESQSRRTSAVELALLLQDKQISQTEWSHQGHSAQTATMAHAEIMQAFEKLGEKVDGMRKEMGALSSRVATAEALLSERPQHPPSSDAAPVTATRLPANGTTPAPRAPQSTQRSASQEAAILSESAESSVGATPPVSPTSIDAASGKPRTTRRLKRAEGDERPVAVSRRVNINTRPDQITTPDDGACSSPENAAVHLQRVRSGSSPSFQQRTVSSSPLASTAPPLTAAANSTEEEDGAEDDEYEGETLSI